MQRVTLVRYTVKPEQAGVNEALSREVFGELRARKPDDVSYALLRNGNEFIHVFLNSKADESAAVTELSTFKAFEKSLIERCEAPPQVTRVAANMLDGYGLAH